MMTVISVVGLAVAAVVFLNLLQAKDNIEEITKPEEVKRAEKEKRERAVQFMKKASSRRMCPVCRTGLEPDEYLICAMDEDRGPGQKRQVHIFGCPHCFTTDGVNLKQFEMVKDF